VLIRAKKLLRISAEPIELPDEHRLELAGGRIREESLILRAIRLSSR
jgi:hypothetical protein